MSAERRTITVEIDPNEPLPERYLGSDEDGPQYGPVSLYDAIIAAARDSLIGCGEKVVRELVVKEMREGIAAVLAEKLPAIIEAALTEKVEVGDGWSSEKKSIRELIGDEIQKELKPSRNSYSGNKTTFDKVIREEVERGIHTELADEVAKARAAVKAQMTQKAAELLATESLRAAGVR